MTMTMAVTMTMTHRITIAVSSCLLGQPVRYDGDHKLHQPITEQICNTFHCLAVCPEVGIGLGVPRAPIHIVDDGGKLRIATTTVTSLGITTSLAQYADKVAQSHPHIRGYIFKARSPSCGIQSTDIWDATGQIVRKGSGLFSARWLKLFPEMPVIEESDLDCEIAMAQFMAQVRAYDARCVGQHGVE